MDGIVCSSWALVPRLALVQVGNGDVKMLIGHPARLTGQGSSGGPVELRQAPVRKDSNQTALIARKE